MAANDMVGSTTSTSFTQFNPEKHRNLCSELKQLYVAVTRTKQRLWICENMEELCGPMFDYWKKLSLVNVRELDAAFIEEVQVASSQEDWKSRGIKVFLYLTTHIIGEFDNSKLYFRSYRISSSPIELIHLIPRYKCRLIFF